jgi:hypothetical protein
MKPTHKSKGTEGGRRKICFHTLKLLLTVLKYGGEEMVHITPKFIFDTYEVTLRVGEKTNMSSYF